ncbi:MAG: murein biosynthesis integral membrane protein MurJ [Epsilonproteobacteria bacterium]|nr:murein biosynthesis integral membrane protein MurJ [Campylobacterota bacterium]
MLRNIIINFLGILNSRVLGFIRDLLMASILGANIYSDIFFAAFKFPNLFRRIFAEGAFASSFLPALKEAKYKATFAFRVFKYFFLATLGLSLIVTLFPYEVTSLIAMGFSQEAKKLAAPLVALNFWYLDLIFIVTFFNALLNYKEHFFVSAFSTALLNISLIGALVVSKDLPKERIVWYLSYGVLIGGLLQVIAVLLAAKYKGIVKIMIAGAKSKKEVSLEKFKKKFVDSLIGNSTPQISSFIDTLLASFLPSGSITYLYYGNRLFQLPLALFAIAIANVLFPKITKISQNPKKALESMKKGFWLTFYLLLFATIVTFISSYEIVKLLFQRGAFGDKDTLITSRVLVMYILSLLPYGLIKIFNSYFYAYNKHALVKKLSLISLGVTLFFSFALLKPLGVYGLALAGSIGSWVLLWMSIKEFGYENIKKLISKRELLLMILVIFGSIIFGYGFKEALIWIDMKLH